MHGSDHWQRYNAIADTSKNSNGVGTLSIGAEGGQN